MPKCCLTGSERTAPVAHLVDLVQSPDGVAGHRSPLTSYVTWCRDLDARAVPSVLSAATQAAPGIIWIDGAGMSHDTAHEPHGDGLHEDLVKLASRRDALKIFGSAGAAAMPLFSRRVEDAGQGADGRGADEI